MSSTASAAAAAAAANSNRHYQWKRTAAGLVVVLGAFVLVMYVLRRLVRFDYTRGVNTP